MLSEKHLNHIIGEYLAHYHAERPHQGVVAALAQDETVAISPIPGTTQHVNEYRMCLDGRVLYTLVDTPGFENARAALAWMKRHETTADQHPQIVARFVHEHRHDKAFRHEVELLQPLLDGAGVLYVVDGSKPYSAQYEAEMEILRWTGQPSMALINPIGAADFIEPWRAVLDQYFRVVRVFNAVTEPFRKRIEVLRGFAQLREAWQAPLEEAAAALQADRDLRCRLAAQYIAQMLADMLSLTRQLHLSAHDDVTVAQAQLEEDYRGRLRQIERRGREDVQQVYCHAKLQRHEADVDVLADDLFSRQTLHLFGQPLHKLIAAGAAGGAALGVAGDLAAGGLVFGVFTILGAVGGGVAAWYGANRLIHAKVMRGPMGGRRVQCGPIVNANFAFVALGRARYHHNLVASRSHAARGDLQIGTAAAGLLNPLTQQQINKLQPLFRKLQQPDLDDDGRARAAADLTPLIEQVLD